MANWQFTLELGEFYHKYPDKITLQECANGVIEKIKELIPKVEERGKTRSIYDDLTKELEEIKEEFEEFILSESDNPDDFDSCMESLYDWADTSLDNEWGGKKMCWVNTI